MVFVLLVRLFKQIRFFSFCVQMTMFAHKRLKRSCLHKSWKVDHRRLIGHFLTLLVVQYTINSIQCTQHNWQKQQSTWYQRVSKRASGLPKNPPMSAPPNAMPLNESDSNIGVEAALIAQQQWLVRQWNNGEWLLGVPTRPYCRLSTQRRIVANRQKTLVSTEKVWTRKPWVFFQTQLQNNRFFGLPMATSRCTKPSQVDRCINWPYLSKQTQLKVQSFQLTRLLLTDYAHCDVQCCWHARQICPWLFLHPRTPTVHSYHSTQTIDQWIPSNIDLKKTWIAAEQKHCLRDSCRSETDQTTTFERAGLNSQPTTIDQANNYLQQTILMKVNIHSTQS